MNVDHIKNIAYFKVEAEATLLMIQDFDGTSQASIGEIGCAAKTHRAPDSRLISIIERRDRLRKQLVDVYEAYLQSVEWGMEELKSIGDPRIRTILILRFVQGYRWEQVARHLGGTATSDSVKKSAERYLSQCRNVDGNTDSN